MKQERKDARNGIGIDDERKRRNTFDQFMN